MATNNTVNRIELIGSMGAMPEMRFTANGAAVTNFSMATAFIIPDAVCQSVPYAVHPNCTAAPKLR